ncbi:7742_t:CDS:10 [Acaulospora morrowiae]|uniref:Ubiquitin carboxyl-terminal hydrolase n=1 Tax=Acaulospora morrowiae TaxID=94023 RepID=A0A9N9BEP2_9GLOM|nr:7742_t:CDS:10 [Acaulospora morrowiae]
MRGSKKKGQKKGKKQKNLKNKAHQKKSQKMPGDIDDTENGYQEDGEICPHVKTSVKPNKLKKSEFQKIFKSIESQTFSEIQCETCAEEKKSKESDSTLETINPPDTETTDSSDTGITDSSGADSTDVGNIDSSNDGASSSIIESGALVIYNGNRTDEENTPRIWICIHCARTSCGRDDEAHALKHYEENKNHAISMDLKEFSFWCYECDKEVIVSTGKNQVLADIHSQFRKAFKKEELKAFDEQTNKKDSRSRNSFNQINHTRNKIPTPGLSNLGNTCFFNSVMQVVTVTSALRDVLQPNRPGQSDLIPPLINAKQCIAAIRDDVGPLTNAFKEFLSVMWEGEREIVSPRDLFDQITRKWSQFRGWRQQDSQELMRFLFDGIKSEELELIKRVSKKKNEDQLSDQGTDDENNTSEEKPPPQEFVSFIDACFGGKLASVIVCKTCRMCSYSYEEFLDVSLPIKSNNNEGRFKKMKNFLTGSNNSTQSFYNNSEDSNQNGDDESNNSNKEAKPEEYSPLLKEIPNSSDRSAQNSCISLIDCLRSFMRVETLDGDNLFACGNCWKNSNHEGSDVTDEKSDAEEDDSIEPDVQVDKAIGKELENTESLKQSPSTPINTSEVNHMTNTQPENGASEPMDVSGDNSTTDAQIYESFRPHITSTNAPDENSNEPISRDDSEETCVSGADAQSDENPQKSVSEDSEETRISGTDAQSDGISNNSISEGAHVTSTDAQSDENQNHCSNDPSDYTPINGKDGEVDSRGMEVDLPVHSSSSRSSPLHDSESEKNKSTKAQQFILREAYKRYLFSSLPPVLVLHLKRFQQTGKWSISMKKIDDFVEFDEEIDVGNFIVPPGADDIDGSKSSRKKVFNTKYRLYGVVVHMGSLYNGHYIAYVLSKNILGTGEQFGVPELNPDDYEEVEKIHSKSDMVGEHKQWIYCSDSNVRMAKVDEVLRSEAYLLFYEQVR